MRRWLLILIALASLGQLAHAQEGRLFLQVRDLRGDNVRGIRFTSGPGNPTGEPTDRTGRTWIALRPAARPGDWVSVNFAEGPVDQWVLISPPDNRIALPAFKPGSREVFAQVIVARRGEPALLVDGRAVKAITLAILKRLSPGSHSAITRELRAAALGEEAKRFGLAPGELEPAIRMWAQKSRDPGAKAIAAYYQGDFAQAEKLAAESVKAKEADLVVGYLVWAESLLWQAKYAESSDVFRKALVVGGESTRVLTELALSLTYEARYQEAEPLFRRAVELAGSDGSTTGDLAGALNGLGNVSFRQAHHDEALKAYSRAFDIKDSPVVDVTIAGIGRVFMAIGRYVDAEVAFKRALEIRERALGPNQFEVGVSLNDLGTLYLQERKYEDAEKVLTRALTIMRGERKLGPTHPFAATVMGNLARAYADQGKFAEAEPLYRKSIEIEEKTLGPEHPDVAVGLTNLALFYGTQGKFGEAEQLYRRAAAIYEKRLGDHPNLAHSLNDLGAMYQAMGRNQEAETLYKRAVGILEKTLGPNQASVADVLENYASLLRTLRRDREAIEMETRAASIKNARPR
jgi:tetratricopeptide (TPR) repeat protein